MFGKTETGGEEEGFGDGEGCGEDVLLGDETYSGRTRGGGGGGEEDRAGDDAGFVLFGEDLDERGLSGA